MQSCQVDLGSRASLNVTTNLPVWPSAGSTVPCRFDVQDSAFDTYGSPTARRYAASVGEAVDAKSDG